MNDFYKGLFPEKTHVGFNLENSENNKIINEAIVLDRLNGNMSALNTFYGKLGKFGSRDGLLNEDAVTDIKLKSFDDSKCPECAAVLATAKEAKSPDYDLYCKAFILMQACMDNMKKNFGNTAEKRVETQTKIIEQSPRIQDAIEKTKEAGPEEVKPNGETCKFC